MVVILKSRVALILTLCMLGIHSVCLSKQPARSYNFDNGDAFGYGNACWLTSYLQCIYRLEPLHTLLAKLPQEKSNDFEALKFSRLIKKTFDQMSVKEEKKVFPKSFIMPFMKKQSIFFFLIKNLITEYPLKIILH